MTDHLAVLEELRDGNKMDAWPATEAIRVIAALNAAIALMRGQSEDMVLVPRRLTYENGAKGALIGEFKETLIMRCHECDEGYVDDEVCDECGGSGEFGVKVPVSWDTIKTIHEAMVAHFYPKQERDDA